MSIKDRERLPSEEYQYGFKDDIKPVVDFGQGLSEQIVREISKIKNEPDWMLDYRLKAYEHFINAPMPTWGADLSDIDFESYIYYLRASERSERKWEDVPEEIRNTFDRLGIPEAEGRHQRNPRGQHWF